jgi:hypothetical protein
MIPLITILVWNRKIFFSKLGTQIVNSNVSCNESLRFYFSLVASHLRKGTRRFKDTNFNEIAKAIVSRYHECIDPWLNSITWKTLGANSAEENPQNCAMCGKAKAAQWVQTRENWSSFSALLLFSQLSCLRVNRALDYHAVGNYHRNSPLSSVPCY